MSQIINLDLSNRDIPNVSDVGHLRELKEWIVRYLGSHDNTDELDEFVALYNCHPYFNIHYLLDDLSAIIYQQEHGDME